MGETSAHGNSDIPCALKSYVKPGKERQQYGGLPQYACLIAFLHWSTDSCTQTGDDSAACFRCPMLWCRDKFDKSTAVLQHIPQCPCLEDGHYWCTECSRPERFMEVRKCVEDWKNTSTPSRKDSRLKRASTFFKGLGHGNSSTKQKAKVCGNSVIEASSAALTRRLSSLIDKKRRKYSQHVTIPKESESEAGCKNAPAVSLEAAMGSVSMQGACAFEAPGLTSCCGDAPSYKEAIGVPSVISKHSDIMRNLYMLDNLAAEDLRQMFDEFDEAHSYLRAEICASGLEVANQQPFGTSNQVSSTKSAEVTTICCAELDATEQAIPLPGPGEGVSRSVSPFYACTSSRPISPSPVSPLGNLLEDEGPDDAINARHDDSHLLIVDTDPLNRGVWSSGDDSSLLESLPPIPTQPIDVDNPVTEEAQATTSPTLLLYNTPEHMALPAPDQSSEPLENSTFQTTEARVKEICALVTVVNQEWLERMTKSPRLLSRCVGLSTSTLFEKGISALQRCFRGDIPDTFLELFGLAHIACAVAYTFHKGDDWCRWEELFVDLQQWQYALDRDTERRFYSEALELLKRPKAPPNGWLKQLNPATASMCDPWPLADFESVAEALASGFTESPLFSFPQDFMQQCCYDPPVKDLLQMLTHGRIVKDCAIFLDDLEHSGIADRNKALLPGHFAWYTRQKDTNISHLLEHLVTPLQDIDGFEALKDIIVDAEFQVKSGLLRTPREVEVALAYGGRFYSKTRSYYERFHQSVSCLCNQAMQNFDPTWRNAYYAADLDKVLAVAFEMDSQSREPQASSLDTGPSTPDTSNLVVQPKRMVRSNPPPRLAIANTRKRRMNAMGSSLSKSPTSAPLNPSMSSPTSASRASTTSSSFAPSPMSSTAQFTTPLSTTSFSFTISPVSANCENFTLSPTVLATPSSAISSSASSQQSGFSESHPNSHPISRPNSNHEDSITYCPSCPAKFTGNFQYRRSNLRRHLRTTSKHGTVEGPRCPEEGCGKIFSRSDNLALHVQRVHGGVVEAGERGERGENGEWKGDGGEGSGNWSKRRRWTDG